MHKFCSTLVYWVGMLALVWTNILSGNYCCATVAYGNWFHLLLLYTSSEDNKLSLSLNCSVSKLLVNENILFWRRLRCQESPLELFTFHRNAVATLLFVWEVPDFGHLTQNKIVFAVNCCFFELHWFFESKFIKWQCEPKSHWKQYQYSNDYHIWIKLQMYISIWLALHTTFCIPRYTLYWNGTILVVATLFICYSMPLYLFRCSPHFHSMNIERQCTYHIKACSFQVK